MGFHTNNEEVGKVNKEVMIVTGAGQISMAIARRLGYGKKIIIGDKNIDNANRITKIMNDAGFDVIPVEMDLSSRKSILKMIKVAQNYGEISMLVNGAGVSPSQASIETILKVDLYGTAVLLEEIGKVIQALKEQGMYDNALICYISDHGDMLGDHYHWRKTYPYEGSVHIPYIVKWPSKCHFDKGAKIEAPVELRDLLPTFIDLAGGTVPADMDGKSLTALMKGDIGKWRKYIDLEHSTCYSPDNYWCALTDGKIKYIWRFHTGEEELFDLLEDPCELKNVVKEKRYHSRLLHLREAMVSHLSERGEEFVKDGKLQILKHTVLYSPLFPDENPVDTGI